VEITLLPGKVRSISLLRLTPEHKTAAITSNGGTHQNDWRLPNIRELQSLVDYGTFNQALTKDFQAYPVTGFPFLNFQALTYWSSTTHAFSSLEAWTVDFNLGFTGGGGSQIGRFVKTDTNNLIAVRGGF